MCHQPGRRSRCSVLPVSVLPRGWFLLPVRCPSLLVQQPGVEPQLSHSSCLTGSCRQQRYHQCVVAAVTKPPIFCGRFTCLGSVYALGASAARASTTDEASAISSAMFCIPSAVEFLSSISSAAVGKALALRVASLMLAHATQKLLRLCQMLDRRAHWSVLAPLVSSSSPRRGRLLQYERWMYHRKVRVHHQLLHQVLSHVRETNGHLCHKPFTDLLGH